MPLSFFSNRTRVATNGVTIFFSSGFFAYFYLQTLYLQQMLHWSPLKTGLSLPAVRRQHFSGHRDRHGAAAQVGAKNGCCWRASRSVRWPSALLTRLTIHSSYAADVLPSMVLLAVGAGLCFPAITNASLHGVSGENASLASGVQNAVQQIGGALGIAVFTTIAVSYVHGLSFTGPGYPAKATDGYTSGFAWAADRHGGRGRRHRVRGREGGESSSPRRSRPPRRPLRPPSDPAAVEPDGSRLRRARALTSLRWEVRPRSSVARAAAL